MRVTLSPKSILVWVAITAAAVLGLMFVYLALDAITWVLVAAFFAMALNPAVEALVRRGLGRARAAAIVFVIAFAALGLLGFLVIPPLVTATTEFVEALPRYLRDLDAGRGPLAFLERRFHLGEQLVDVYERGGIAGLFGLERPGASTARAAADTALALIAVPFLTFFMLLDGRRWADGVLDVMPPSARPRWERVFDGINRTVGGYVTHVLGHFPKMGEKLRVSEYEVTTTKVEARRVGQLHFKRLEKSKTEAGAAAEALEEAQR